MRSLLLLPLLPSLCLSIQYVWQITDVHVDEQYVPTGSPETYCHQDDRKPEQWFGQRGCGLPWRTVQLGIDFMRDTIQNPDVVLWTGDTAPHWPYGSWDDVFPKLRRVTSMLRTAFPEAQIVPAIGNHDAYPSDQFPSENGTFYERYLIESGWNELLPETARQTFRKGGYYRIDVNGVRYLVLNTNLYYHKNRMTRDDGGRDPSGQLDWLKEQLEDVQQVQTIVTGHVAPGFPHWSVFEMQLRGQYNHALLRVLEKGHRNIVANIFGHEHIDTFKHQYRDDLSFDQHTYPLNIFFLAPALYPGTKTQDVNPSVRLYVLQDPPNSIVNDIIQGHMDLQAANAAHRSDASVQGKDFWKLTYRLREIYGLGDVSKQAMHQFYKELRDDDSKFAKFWRMTGGNHSNVPACDSKCRHEQLCVMRALNSQQMSDCWSGAATNMVSLLVMVVAMLMQRVAA